MISRIDNNVKATDIIQEVDIFAWGEISDQTVINCFHRCGFRKEHPNLQVLDQEEEEEFTSLLKQISSDPSPSNYIEFDIELAMSQSPVDKESIAL